MNMKERIIKRESAKPGMRGKVNAKCAECIYDDLGGNGTWRQQIEACSATDCPLWPIRPTSNQDSPEGRTRPARRNLGNGAAQDEKTAHRQAQDG